MGKGLLYVLTSFSLPPIHSYAGPHGIPAMRCHSSQTDHVWLSHRVQLLKNWSNNCFIPQGSSSRSCSRTWREKPPRVATPPDLLLLSMGCSSGQGLILFFLFFPFIPFYFFFLFVFLFFFLFFFLFLFSSFFLSFFPTFLTFLLPFPQVTFLQLSTLTRSIGHTRMFINYFKNFWYDFLLVMIHVWNDPIW